MAGVAGVLAVGGLAALYVRRRGGAAAVTAQRRRRWPGPIAAVRWPCITGGVLALGLLPDLSTAFDQRPASPTCRRSPPVDHANLAVWSSFVEHGLVPTKDFFFYPYGYQWTFDAVPGRPADRVAGPLRELALIGGALGAYSTVT